MARERRSAVAAVGAFSLWPIRLYLALGFTILWELASTYSSQSLPWSIRITAQCSMAGSRMSINLYPKLAGLMTRRYNAQLQQDVCEELIFGQPPRWFCGEKREEHAIKQGYGSAHVIANKYERSRLDEIA